MVLAAVSSPTTLLAHIYRQRNTRKNAKKKGVAILVVLADRKMRKIVSFLFAFY